MHQHIINASIQLIPIVQDRHPYLWVDEAIALIQQSGIKHKVGAFATEVEGTYQEVMALVHAINEYLVTHHCNEWITNVQLQIRSSADMTGDEKTAKFIA